MRDQVTLLLAMKSSSKKAQGIRDAILDRWEKEAADE